MLDPRCRKRKLMMTNRQAAGLGAFWAPARFRDPDLRRRPITPLFEGGARGKLSFLVFPRRNESACVVIWLAVYSSDMASDREETQRRRRRLHEELRALSFAPLMRGTIVERLRRCGRANCACAKDPSARHGGLFLTVHLGGRTEAAHVRPEDEEQLRKAIAAYARLWEIINELTACELSDLRRAARERRRSRRRRRQ